MSRIATLAALLKSSVGVQSRCPTCRTCGSEQVNSTVKTSESTYYRCRQCGEVWDEVRTETEPRGPYRRRRGDHRLLDQAGAPDARPGEADEPGCIDTPSCPFCRTPDRVTLADAVAPWWDARFFTCSRCGTEWATGPLFSDRRRVPRKTEA